MPRRGFLYYLVVRKDYEEGARILLDAEGIWTTYMSSNDFTPLHSAIGAGPISGSKRV